MRDSVDIKDMTRNRASLLILGLAAFLVSADVRVITPVSMRVSPN